MDGSSKNVGTCVISSPALTNALMMMWDETSGMFALLGIVVDGIASVAVYCTE